jgi:hypothetical protein
MTSFHREKCFHSAVYTERISKSQFACIPASNSCLTAHAFQHCLHECAGAAEIVAKCRTCQFFNLSCLTPSDSVRIGHGSIGYRDQFRRLFDSPPKGADDWSDEGVTVCYDNVCLTVVDSGSKSYPSLLVSKISDRSDSSLSTAAKRSLTTVPLKLRLSISSNVFLCGRRRKPP